MSGIKPPFTAETALQKTKAAQNLWNSKDPAKVALAYTVSSCVSFGLQFARANTQVSVWHGMGDSPPQRASV